MKTYEASTLLGHEPCPACRRIGGDNRGNNLARYDDGHGYCFACGYYEYGESGEKYMEKEKEYKKLDMIDVEIRNLPKRGITEKTCSVYGYGIGEYKGEKVQVAPYFDKDGKLIAQHLRFADKTFKWTGDISKAQMFGQQLCRGGGKRIIVTEGEIDAMTVSQFFDNKYPAVSIPSGAKSGVKAFKDNLEWLESYETVVIAFDMDEEGRKAANECALLLSPNKASIAWLPAKDANECLQKGLEKQLISALWDAKPYRPDGIVSGTEIKEACEAKSISGIETPFTHLNSKILGLRGGELLLFTAGSGVGKSTLVHEIAYHAHQEYHVPVGLICLEESIGKTGRRWISMRLNKNLNLPDAAYTQDEFDGAFKETVGRGDWYAYNHFGSMDTGNLLSKMRYMAVALGVKIIVLDHISIVVSGLEGAEGNDERKTLDVFMTKLRSLVEETAVTVLAVCHLKRPDKGKSWNEGRQVSLTDLRGSGGLEQLSDIVIALERDQQSGTETSDTSYIRVLKNRFTGDCGEAGGARYNMRTGRLLPCESPDADSFNFTAEHAEETGF